MGDDGGVLSGVGARETPRLQSRYRGDAYDGTYLGGDVGTNTGEAAVGGEGGVLGASASSSRTMEWQFGDVGGVACPVRRRRFASSR